MSSCVAQTPFDLSPVPFVATPLAELLVGAIVHSTLAWRHTLVRNDIIIFSIEIFVVFVLAVANLSTNLHHAKISCYSVATLGSDGTVWHKQRECMMRVI